MTPVVAKLCGCKTHNWWLGLTAMCCCKFMCVPKYIVVCRVPLPLRNIFNCLHFHRTRKYWIDVVAIHKYIGLFGPPLIISGKLCGSHWDIYRITKNCNGLSWGWYVGWHHILSGVKMLVEILHHITQKWNTGTLNDKGVWFCSIWKGTWYSQKVEIW